MVVLFRSFSMAVVLNTQNITFSKEECHFLLFISFQNPTNPNNRQLLDKMPLPVPVNINISGGGSTSNSNSNSSGGDNKDNSQYSDKFAAAQDKKFGKWWRYLHLACL